MLAKQSKEFEDIFTHLSVGHQGLWTLYEFSFKYYRNQEQCHCPPLHIYALLLEQCVPRGGLGGTTGIFKGSKEMIQCFRTMIALAEAPSFVPSTNVMASNHL